MSAADGPARKKFPLPLDRLRAAPAPKGAAGAAQGPLLRPQHHAAAAHAGARRGVATTGLGLDSADVRWRMVQRLQAGGVVLPQVLAAFAHVPRHVFVDAALATQAYEDTSLPIGHGQTISKPSVVARMLELLFAGAQARRTGSLGNVLEVGTGCGYQAALLAQLGQRVLSIERLQPLHERARATLAPMRSPRLRLVYGDGIHGHAPNAPYDSIIAAAAIGDDVPLAWLEQLAIGGRLVAPIRDGASAQRLVIVDRNDAGYARTLHEAVRFVPLKSGLGR